MNSKKTRLNTPCIISSQPSLVLIGGDPGIGKSTLMLQITGALAKEHSVLYVSGEESASQIKMRADRLGVSNSGILLYPETNMQNIRDQIDEIKPDFLVIDSIQTMNEPSLDSMVGSASQVREVTSELMKIAKNEQITTFVIGHVTKEGAIAGPKIMEHMVDTVLYFEGDGHHSYRILRSVKNRFGAANEIGMFEMKNEGLAEVSNPSAIFLDERLPNTTGTTVVVSLDCFVCEDGLTVEIRRVNQNEARVKEAAKVGFKRIFIPKNNLNQDLKNNSEIEVIGVASLPQALKLVFN